MPTALITGANRGIGLEICRLLKGRAYDLIGVCRKSSPELEALGVQVLDGVDLRDESSIESLGERVAGQSIDLLVNNAGILVRHGLDNLTTEELRAQFEVNAMAPLLVTKALLPNLASGSKIALVTSRMGSIADNTSGGAYGYRMSKAALNAAGMSLAVDLKPRGIAVVILHPGWVKTGMTHGTGNVGPAESARGLLQRIDELSLATTGSFLHAEGRQLPW